MLSQVLCLTLFVAHCFAGIPWVGEPRDAKWLKKHEILLNQTADHKAELKVIFFGDSITARWAGNGKEVWNKYYAPRHAFNYGIDGDRTEHLIWRIKNGEFEGLDSKVVVLKIGTNNLGYNTEEDIAHGIKEVINQIEKHQPHCKIVLLGIIPRKGELEKKVQTINALIAKYDDQKRIFFLDMSPHFQTAPGVEVADLYTPDKVHLVAKGYQVWHDVMEPIFSKLYNSQAWLGEPRDANWVRKHEQLMKQTAYHKSDLKVIFFGDSITEGWNKNGLEVWNKYYAPRHAFNYGVGGDRTEHLIWRMEHGEFDWLDSKVVVLRIGTNNLWIHTEEEIAHGIKEIISQIEKRQPHAKVLLLGILPIGGDKGLRQDPGRTKIQAINTKLIAKFDDQKRVFYLDQSPHFQTAPGVVIDDLYQTDKEHLIAKGYQVWYDSMEPLFAKLLK